MPFLAGQRITAARLQRLQPAEYSATGTANVVLTSSDQVLTGAQVTLVSETAGATFVCQGFYSFDITSDTTDYAEGTMYLDGTKVSGSVRWAGANSSNFAMAAQMWRGSLGAAGAHTFDLRAFKSGSTGGIQTLGAFTNLLVTVYEVV